MVERGEGRKGKESISQRMTHNAYTDEGEKVIEIKKKIKNTEKTREKERKRGREKKRLRESARERIAVHLETL